MPGKALLLVDHGSRQPEAAAVLDEVAALLRQSRPGLIVHVAHMTLAQPDIARGFERCVQDGATEVIVHPYMLSPGRHVLTDMPRLVAESAARHAGVTFRITPPLGVHGKLAEVVLERAGLA
ncbi:MAG: cobalamin biosynthesis protein CbiX [Planctomycetota bacterium]|nr:cobalamin biosynthesis protein CbiX [Planctomycetota bacterium]